MPGLWLGPKPAYNVGMRPTSQAWADDVAAGAADALNPPSQGHASLPNITVSRPGTPMGNPLQPVATIATMGNNPEHLLSGTGLLRMRPKPTRQGIGKEPPTNIGVLSPQARLVHSEAIVKNADHTHVAEQLHSLLCDIDPDHTQYVQTPMLHHLDPVTLAWCVLLVKEATQGQLPSQSSKIKERLVGTPAGKLRTSALGGVQLTELVQMLDGVLEGAVTKMRETGHARPANQRYDFVTMTAPERSSLLKRMYGQGSAAATAGVRPGSAMIKPITVPRTDMSPPRALDVHAVHNRVRNSGRSKPQVNAGVQCTLIDGTVGSATPPVVGVAPVTSIKSSKTGGQAAIDMTAHESAARHQAALAAALVEADALHQTALTQAEAKYKTALEVALAEAAAKQQAAFVEAEARQQAALAESDTRHKAALTTALAEAEAKHNSLLAAALSDAQAKYLASSGNADVATVLVEAENRHQSALAAALAEADTKHQATLAAALAAALAEADTKHQAALAAALAEADTKHQAALAAALAEADMKHQAALAAALAEADMKHQAALAAALAEADTKHQAALAAALAEADTMHQAALAAALAEADMKHQAALAAALAEADTMHQAALAAALTEHQGVTTDALPAAQAQHDAAVDGALAAADEKHQAASTATAEEAEQKPQVATADVMAQHQAALIAAVEEAEGRHQAALAAALADLEAKQQATLAEAEARHQLALDAVREEAKNQHEAKLHAAVADVAAQQATTLESASVDTSAALIAAEEQHRAALAAALAEADAKHQAALAAAQIEADAKYEAAVTAAATETEQQHQAALAAALAEADTKCQAALAAAAAQAEEQHQAALTAAAEQHQAALAAAVAEANAKHQAALAVAAADADTRHTASLSETETKQEGPGEPTSPEEPTSSPEQPTSSPEQPTSPEEPTNPEQPTNPDKPTNPDEPTTGVLSPMDTEAIYAAALAEANTKHEAALAAALFEAQAKQEAVVVASLAEADARHKEEMAAALAEAELRVGSTTSPDHHDTPEPVGQQPCDTVDTGEQTEQQPMADAECQADIPNVVDVAPESAAQSAEVMLSPGEPIRVFLQQANDARAALLASAAWPLPGAPPALTSEEPANGAPAAPTPTQFHSQLQEKLIQPELLWPPQITQQNAPQPPPAEGAAQGQGGTEPSPGTTQPATEPTPPQQGESDTVAESWVRDQLAEACLQMDQLLGCRAMAHTAADSDNSMKALVFDLGPLLGAHKVDDTKQAHQEGGSLPPLDALLHLVAESGVNMLQTCSTLSSSTLSPVSSPSTSSPDILEPVVTQARQVHCALDTLSCVLDISRSMLDTQQSEPHYLQYSHFTEEGRPIAQSEHAPAPAPSCASVAPGVSDAHTGSEAPEPAQMPAPDAQPTTPAHTAVAADGPPQQAIGEAKEASSGTLSGNQLVTRSQQLLQLLQQQSNTVSTVVDMHMLGAAEALILVCQPQDGHGRRPQVNKVLSCLRDWCDAMAKAVQELCEVDGVQLVVQGSARNLSACLEYLSRMQGALNDLAKSAAGAQDDTIMWTMRPLIQGYLLNLGLWWQLWTRGIHVAWSLAREAAAKDLIHTHAVEAAHTALLLKHISALEEAATAAATAGAAASTPTPTAPQVVMVPDMESQMELGLLRTMCRALEAQLAAIPTPQPKQDTAAQTETVPVVEQKCCGR